MVTMKAAVPTRVKLCPMNLGSDRLYTLIISAPFSADTGSPAPEHQGSPQAIAHPTSPLPFTATYHGLIDNQLISAAIQQGTMGYAKPSWGHELDLTSTCKSSLAVKGELLT